METKRAVIYSHGFCGADNALKDAEELGKAMQSWAKEQGLLPVELIIEISDQSCGIFSPGLDRCTSSLLNDDADVVVVFCKNAISDDINDVIDFISEIENEGKDVISLRNDLPNEEGPHRFGADRPKCEVISFVKVINLV